MKTSPWINLCLIIFPTKNFLRCFVSSFVSWQVLGAINWSCQETNFVACLKSNSKVGYGLRGTQIFWIQIDSRTQASCCWDWYELNLAEAKQNTPPNLVNFFRICSEIEMSPWQNFSCKHGTVWYFSVWATVVWFFFFVCLFFPFYFAYTWDLFSFLFHSCNLTEITPVICGWDWRPLVALIII